MALPFAISDWILWSLIFGLAFLALELKSVKRVAESIEGGASALARRQWLSVWVVFFAAIAARLAMLPLLPFPNPGVHDEFSYLLMADTFAHGRLANATHPMWMSFETFHVNWHPMYASKYPPAQGLLLVLGQLLGHPFIGVLLSVGAMCAAIVWMLQAWMPARWALLGGFIVIVKFALLCYWSNGYFGGCLAATAGALAIGALPRIMGQARVGHAVLMGISIAVLANSRPYEGFVLTLALSAVLLWWISKQQPARRVFALKTVAMPIVAILLCTAGLMAYYNLRVTGSPLLLPHALYQRAYDPTAIFLWQKAGPPRHYNNVQLEHFFNSGMAGQFYHRSWEGARATLMKKVTAYQNVFFWPGALPLLLFLPYAFRDRRTRLLFLIWIPCLIGLTLVVWSFTHYAAPVLCIFYAALVQSLRHMRTLTLKTNHRRIGVTLARVVIVLLLIDTGSEIYTFSEVPQVMGWLGGAGINERADIVAELNKTPGKHLVFVRYDPLHNLNFEWVFNGADIDSSKVIWAREVNPVQDAKLRAYFHDRQFWLIEPDVNAAKLLPYTPPKATTANR